MKQAGPNRRQFLKAATLATAGVWVSTRSGFGQPVESANEMLDIAVVGLGGRGRENLKGLVANKAANIVALCDVNQKAVDAAGKDLPKAQKYQDYRKLLEQKNIDAVLVATPDHTHFHASLASIQSGRHIYCEKPLTHQLWEARALSEATLKHKRVSQMGTQIHAGENYRQVVELIQAGAIGAVKEVHVFVSPRWHAPGRPKTVDPVPATLNWDLYVGPAAPWGYNRSYEPMNWRSFWNFGNGTLGDMACHHMDLPFWALGLKHPSKITPVSGAKPNPDGCPEGSSIRWDFPADGARSAVALWWHSGEEHYPEHYADWGLPAKTTNGNVFVGEKGILHADYGSHTLLPKETFKDYKQPQKTIPRSIGHHNEWIAACKSGDVAGTTCHFGYSGLLTETVLLGCAAYRAQTPLEWDGPNLKVTNTREADQYLKYAYRKGWEVSL